ncbi:MAG: YdeI/OmpD-associated family protein [Janibacter sp.]
MSRASVPGGDGAEVIAFRDAEVFDRWLEDHVGEQAGVWLKLAKKGSGIPSMTSDEAVDVGLCHGWISGQRRSLDDQYYLQKYVPRRPRSRWSRVNVAKVEELTAAGRMRPAGLAEVEAAKADGRWEAAYVSQKDATVPPDLAAALTADARADAAFAALGRTDRYAVILDLVTARTETARAQRLERAVARLAKEET